MTWGIISALEQELSLILREMRVEKTRGAYGAVFHDGFIGENHVVAVCSGIGTINAAVCASTVIRELGAEAVINIGVAGSVCPELRALDVALADELVFHDAQTSFLEKYYPFRGSFPTDGRLLELARASLENMPDRNFRYRVGRIATGDIFVDDDAVKSDIVKRCAPLCVEMEGAAIAQVAFMNEIPCLVIRSMSDSASEGAAETFAELLELAAKHSARVVLDMIGR